MLGGEFYKIRKISLSNCGLSIVGSQTESLLVDTPATRWQAVEPEQLPDRHDPSPWRCGGHSGTHAF